jgi:hypothetical protein
MAANSLRSSAISMFCGEVPMMLTPFFWRPRARLGDGAPAFLAFVDVEDVLQSERLEEELVRRVVVGGDGLWVRVDHDGLEAVFLEGKRRMDAAVVELDALADAVGAAAEDHDLLGRVALHLVVAAVVGGIVVGRVGLEFGRACVDKAVAGNETDLLALGADGVLGGAGQMADLAVGEPE